MSTMRPIYCFIDDSSFEIALFQDLFPKEIPGIEFVCASSFHGCKMILEKRSVYPSLFILDLYVALNRLGCFEIFIKPMGRNNDEIRLKTKEQLHDLIAEWNEVVRKRYLGIFRRIDNQK